MINAIRWGKGKTNRWHIAGPMKRRTRCGINIWEAAAIITEEVAPLKVCRACRGGTAPVAAFRKSKVISHETVEVATRNFLKAGGIIEKQPPDIEPQRARKMAGNDGWQSPLHSELMVY